MRLRRPAIAATTLGLAGALLPASGAAAAEPADRHVVYSENVTYGREEARRATAQWSPARLNQRKEYSSVGLVFAEVSEGTWPFDSHGRRAK
jgi:hypothetical protein